MHSLPWHNSHGLCMIVYKVGLACHCARLARSYGKITLLGNKSILDVYLFMISPYIIDKFIDGNILTKKFDYYFLLCNTGEIPKLADFPKILSQLG